MNNILIAANALIQTSIMIFYFNGFLHKSKKRYCIIVAFMAVLLNVTKACLKIPSLYNLMLSISVSLAVAFINYTDKKIKKIFSVCIYVVIMMISEIISENILSACMNISYADVPIMKPEHMASLTTIISFMILFYIAVIPTKKIREIPLKYWIIILALPIFSFFVIIIFDMLVTAAAIPHMEIYSILITAGLLYFNIIIFDFFENYSARIRLEQTETIINNNKKNYQILKNNEHDLRILKHDIKKHINIIKELLKTNDIDGINKYIEALDNVVASIDSITYTNHITLDSILNIESAKAKAANIRYLVKSNIQAEINIDDIDLTTILCNAIDNAIEAASNADKKYVVITINVYNDYVDITIDNSYSKILVPNDDFITTKKDAINHGFGISSIKKVIAKYDGEMQNERAFGMNTMKIRLVNE